MRLQLILMLAGCIAGLQAQAEPSQHLFDRVSLYAAQGVDHNLREIPRHAVEGQLEWESSRFEALGLGRQVGTLGGIVPNFSGTLIAPLQWGYELVLAQHRGLQHNGEIGAAFTLRTPDLELGPVRTNVMGGMGMSQALGTPSYEDGPKAEPQKRYRTQLLLLYELEWRLRGSGHFALIMRGHHRSGAYGVIAPRKVGSNFLGLGLRYLF